MLELDGLNPQVAARLLAPFGQWRRYDEGRQSLIKGEIERVLAKEGLSRGTYENRLEDVGLKHSRPDSNKRIPPMPNQTFPDQIPAGAARISET